MLNATGTYVLFTDADLSTPIDELERLYHIAEREPADIVIGSRAIDRRWIERHQSKFREIGGIVFNRMVRIGMGLNLYDTQCGFKLFHRARTRPIFEKQTIDGFGLIRRFSSWPRSAGYASGRCRFDGVTLTTRRCGRCATAFAWWETSSGFV